MNSVRRLTVVGALIIGTLGLGVPTTFAASPYTSYAPNGPHTTPRTTWAPDRVGRTEYYTDNSHYQIYDMGRDWLAVGAHFYRDGDFYRDRNYQHVDFLSCNKGAGGSCSGDLPKWFTGRLCVKTGVGRHGDNAIAYTYGEYDCFHVGP